VNIFKPTRCIEEELFTAVKKTRQQQIQNSNRRRNRRSLRPAQMEILMLALTRSFLSVAKNVHLPEPDGRAYSAPTQSRLQTPGLRKWM